MAWNTPGSPGNKNSGDGERNVWKRRSSSGNGGGFGPLFERLRGVFDGGGGGPLRWIAIGLGLWLVFNCFVLITEQERGVVLRFGKFSRILQSGPHFKAPWPIESVTKVNATQSNSYSDKVPVLTRDLNMVSVDVNVQYKIGDAQRYLFGAREADEVLKQATQSAVREQIGRSDMDTVLFARGPLSVTVKERLQQSLDAYRTGLEVTELNLPDARYPDEVKDAFDEAQRASQDKSTSINQAQAYAVQIVPEARGEAARTRTTAQGYKTSNIARAQGDADRFTMLVEQYKLAPEVTRKRLWLETVQQVLSDNRKVIGGDGRQLIYVPMDGKRSSPSAAVQGIIPAELVSPTVNATTNDTRPERSARPGRDEVTR